jgi:transcription elongation factor GreA
MAPTVTDSTEPRSAPATGASDLMRSLGLLVDGPQVWTGAVRSRAAGVFVIELPGGADSAPVDYAALEQWLERVPDLRLHSERPTARELAAYLHSFWLPAEPVLYVGRSAKSIGARIAALQATPLGDARPFAGAHWLKTLSVAPRLRIWWAETDAYEEYEDGLLSEIAARTPPAVSAALPDPAGVLPFANLVTGAGRSKAAALANALREPVANATDAPAAAGGRPARPKTAARRPSTPRARTKPAAADQRPAAEPAYVSQDGLDRLHEELAELRTGVRPGVIERVKAARELGDLRENAEYESARKEQSFVEGRIQTLEALLKAAVVVDAPVAPDAAGVGSTVVVEADGEQQSFVLVGSSEADPGAGRISYSSPVGAALLGRRPGDEVTVPLPRGEIRYRIREIR